MATPTPVFESKPGQIAAKTNRPRLETLDDILWDIDQALDKASR
nr:hypothetical protein [Rhodoferax sp.]